MDPFKHSVVVAHFLAGDRVDIYAIDVTPPTDPDDGDAEYYRRLSMMSVVRLLKKANPSIRVYHAPAPV